MTDQKATRIRYLIVGAATLMAFLLYLDRFCVSFAVDYIRQDLDLSQEQISWFLSAFFWSYALAQVPSGWLSDRYGARIMLCIYILTWSLFTGLIGASTTFFMLLATRLATGLGQAGAYPTAASVVGRWVPLTARGTASAMVANGGRIGGALAPVLTAFLIVAFVPQSAPVALTSGDLLKPGKIAARLTEDEDKMSAAVAAIAGHLDDDDVLTLRPDGDKQRFRDCVARLRKLDEEAEPHWYHFVTDLFSSRRSPEEIDTDRDAQWKRMREMMTQLDATSSEIAAALDPRQLELVADLYPPMDASEVAVLSDTMNALLDGGVLYDAEAMPSISLPSEAMNALKLFEQEPSSLSDAQTRRLNRFILEGVFGNEVRKLYGRGWRPVLYIYGVAGILVAAFFWYFFRERPETHPWSNEAEHALILRGREESAKNAGKQIGAAPVKELVLSGNMWCCCLMQWGTNIGWLFLMTWLPRYLLDVHQVPILERATMTMIPPLIGMIGMFCGGSLTDILGAKLGVKWGRRLPIAGSRVTAILAYVGCIGLSMLPAEHSLNTPWVFVGLFSIVAFSTDFGAAPTWAFSQDVGGRQVGAVLGWGNMWGNLGAAVAPPIYNHFLGENPTLSDWNTMFGICAASFLVSAFCALIIDASKPIAPEAD